MYPAFLKCCGSVVKFPAFSLQYVAPLFENCLVVSGLLPVRNEVLLGAHTASWEVAVEKRTERPASLSRFGVCTIVLP